MGSETIWDMIQRLTRTKWTQRRSVLDKASTLFLQTSPKKWHISMGFSGALVPWLAPSLPGSIFPLTTKAAWKPTHYIRSRGPESGPAANQRPTIRLLQTMQLPPCSVIHGGEAKNQRCRRWLPESAADMQALLMSKIAPLGKHTAGAPPPPPSEKSSSVSVQKCT